MNFQNIEKIKEKFNLESDDVSEIRKQLLEILKQIHPDNNDGDFKSDDDKEEFNLLTGALEFLKSQNKPESLIQLNKNNDIIKSETNDYLIQAEKEERINKKKDELRLINKTSSKANYFFPRLSAGVFLCICGLIITFAEQLQKHPLFSPVLNYGIVSQRTYLSELEKDTREYLRDKEFKELRAKTIIDKEDFEILEFNLKEAKRKEYEAKRKEYEAKRKEYEAKREEIGTKEYEEEIRARKPEMLESYKEHVSYISNDRLNYFLIILIFLFLYSGFLFIITWIQERRDEANSEWLLSEEGLRYCFQQFSNQKLNQNEQPEIQFNRRDLESEIKKFYEKRARFRLPLQPNPKANSSFVEKTAKFYIEEMSNRNLIKMVETRKFDVTYEIGREIVEDLIKEATNSDQSLEKT